MIKIIIALALLCCSFQQLVPISVSSPESTFTEPGHFPTQLVDQPLWASPFYLNQNYGSQWIRTTDWNSPNPVSFHTVFKASCASPATLYITARGAFKARLNEGEEMAGNGGYIGFSYENSFHVFDFPFDGITCGENTLVADVYRTNKQQALIFAIVQDQKRCYKCDNNRSHWDNDRCKCTCNTIDKCQSSFGPMVWSGYPTCGCKCRNVLSCPDNQYFDTNDCVCKCKEVSCYRGYFQDQFSCDCVSMLRQCPDHAACTGLKVYSWETCSCRCRQEKVCTYPFISDSNCGCYCPFSNVACRQDVSIAVDRVFKKFG